jgi:hypothetical protein
LRPSTTQAHNEQHTTKPSPPPNPNPPKTKPKKVIKALGRGSFGTVYKVERAADGLSYAMKETDLGKMTPQERHDAVNEIRVLGSLSHPNIVRQHEAFVAGTKLCIVMELAPSGAACWFGGGVWFRALGLVYMCVASVQQEKVPSTKHSAQIPQKNNAQATWPALSRPPPPRGARYPRPACGRCCCSWRPASTPCTPPP